MLNQILLQIFNSYINPVIENLCGNNKGQELFVKTGITASFYGINAALLGHTEKVARIFYALSSVSCSGIIMDSVDRGLTKTKSWITDKLDDYGYDKYIYLIDPAVDIFTGITLRQMAGLSTSLPNMTSHMSAKTVPVTSLENTTKKTSVGPDDASSGFFGKIFNTLGTAVFTLGQAAQYNEGHLISNSLDMVGGNLLLNGVIKLATNIGSSILNFFSGSNKAELSVYDIKEILRTQISSEDYNRTIVKAQAEQIFMEIQKSNQYIESFKNQTEIQEKIYIVTGLYIKNNGLELKSQYSSSLRDNPELLHKSEMFVDKLMEVNVTNRLLNARECFSKIAQLKGYGIEIPIEMKLHIKQAADCKLNGEIDANFKNISNEEKEAYKSLFSRAAVIEIEFEQLTQYYLAMQQLAEAPSDFA